MDLVSLLIIVIVFGLLAYVIQSLLPMPAPFKNAAMAVLVLILIVYLLSGVHLGHTLFIK
jgi:uncharacterized membrane protein